MADKNNEGTEAAIQDSQAQSEEAPKNVDVPKDDGERQEALIDDSLAQQGDAPDTRWLGHDEIQQWAHNLDLGVDAFTDLITKGDKDGNFIPDNKVYGLLALERNGQNRTPYVKVMMKKLKLKSDELPGGGPDYTNDVSNISKL